MKFDDLVRYSNKLLEKSIDELEIVLIAHVIHPRGHNNPKQCNCPETEHFSIQEFNEIYKGVVDSGFFIKKVFFNELEFIQDLIRTPNDYNAKTIIFNMCRNGVGANKKTVVPAICDLVGLKYTSSGAGPCALARNKWLFTSILEANGVRCPASGFCIENLSDRIQHGSKFICKPNTESASQGIDETSIINLEELRTWSKCNYLIQEYIDGYECEVPIFCCTNRCIAMPCVGISFPSSRQYDILTYQVSRNNDYYFYNLADILGAEIDRVIRDDAQKAFGLLGLQGYGRIDFRIDRQTKQHYVIDISTTPYITKHSSFAFSVEQCGGRYEDIFRIIFSSIFDRL